MVHLATPFVLLCHACLAALLALGLIAAPGVAAAGSAASAEGAARQGALEWSLPPEGHELKRRPLRSTIYQVDAEPLGDRRPLLLIHGGDGETQTLFHWGKLVEYLSASDDFKRSYKIYLLRYDSGALLEDSVPQSNEAILALYRSAGRPITMLALSMGGNVAQRAMTDPDVSQAVELVMTMATPFHGSPLFSPDWLQYSLYKGRYFVAVRLLDSVDYQIYFHRHKNYQQDLKWDNADGMMPTVGYFKSKWPLGIKGNLTLGRDSNRELAEINNELAQLKKKFVCYAGYLANPYLHYGPLAHLEKVMLAPIKFVIDQLPAQVGKENPALKVLNAEISQVYSTIPPGARNGRGVYLYAMNDGITPVASAIFLPPDVMRQYPELSELDLHAMRHFVDVRNARVFRNIDHVTFIEGVPPHRGSRLVRDELHPEEDSREIFDWILADLMSVTRQ